MEESRTITFNTLEQKVYVQELHRKIKEYEKAWVSLFEDFMKLKEENLAIKYSVECSGKELKSGNKEKATDIFNSFWEGHIKGDLK